MKPMTKLLAVFILMSALPALGHHSFAIYDIDNKIERTGVLTRFDFSRPHIRLALVVENADGSSETWKIESMNPGRWDRLGKPRDLAEVGETVTLQGWPSRYAVDEMLLSTIITERGRTVIIDAVRQPEARTDIPATATSL